MRSKRLRALSIFEKKPMLNWFADNMPDLDFQNIYYYLKPSAVLTDQWDKVPESIRNTYEKLGIPQAERAYLGA